MVDTKLRMAVAEALDNAKLVAWDTCHKIYVALDDREARWYIDNEWTAFTGPPEAMLDQLEKWYHASCSLVFVDATKWDEENQNSKFYTLIQQGGE
jgi:hypothetical protein